MEQLILHLIGDYVTQTSWMAQEKLKNFFVALLHAFIYSLPFLLLDPSNTAFLVIWISHAIIDRYRLAKYILFAKDWINQPSLKWKDCSDTGYHKDKPIWMSVWLMIIADNTMHLAINYVAFRWL